MSKQTKYNDDLVGQFFHSIEDDHIKWQGVVLSRPETGWYLLQLMEWLNGEPNLRKLIRIEEMAEWLFYPDSETMIFEYEHGSAWHKRSKASKELSRR